MGNKIIAIRCTSPYVMKDHTVIKKIVYVDEGSGERAIDKLQKAIEKLYGDKLFVNGNYAISEIVTLWEE